ncbi:MAG: dienelactone hydrolase family protein [Bacteroidia bacterium]
MKTKVFIISCISAFLFALNVNAQKSCCVLNPNSMEALASNESFKADHLSPIPFELKDQAGKMITFKAADGTPANAYYIPAKTQSQRTLLVFHEWWGLNDYIKQEAQKWQTELGDVNVFAVDLYDGQVATTPEEAGALMGKLDGDHARAIISGLLAYAGKDQQIVTLGWCMGGTWSFEAALLAGKNAKACVMYYGFPEENQEKISKLKTNVLYVHGTQDAYISAEAVGKFAEGVKKSGNTISVESYDAVHAFANPSNPQFDKENATDAATKAKVFLAKALK